MSISVVYLRQNTMRKANAGGGVTTDCGYNYQTVV